MALLDDISILSIKYLLTLAILFPIFYLTWRITYNIFLHPLRALPGPLLWRASGLPLAYYGLIGKVPDMLLQHHEKYGREIRVAPDEISYTDSRAWKDIFNAKPDFPKDKRKIMYAPS